MTYIQFRNDAEKVAAARRIIESEDFQEMLSAMRSIHPVHKTAPRGITAEDAHIMLGEQTGWQQYENEFLKLKERIEPNPNAAPDADYGGEEVQPEVE